MSASDQLQPSIFFRAFDIAFFVPGMILFLAILFSYGEYSVVSASVSNSSSKVSLFDRILDMQESQLSSIAVLQIIVIVLGSYICGLGCHAFSWCWHKFTVDWAKNLAPRNRYLQWATRVLQFIFGLRPKDCREFPPHKRQLDSDSETSDVASETEPNGESADLGNRDGESSLVERKIGRSPSSEKYWTTDPHHYARRVDYFWYLRGTCWNASFAVLVGGILFLFSRWASLRAANLNWQLNSQKTTWSDALWHLRDVDSSYYWGLGAVLICSYLLSRIGTRFGASCESRKAMCKHVSEHQVPPINQP